HSGDEPLLISGVGTHTLEVLQEQPHVDTVIVPIGGGSGAAGACIVAKAVNPGIKVIGVQSDQAQAAYLSWKSGSLQEAPNQTRVEGLATATPFELPQRILRRLLDDFALVSDDETDAATAAMIEKTRTLVEAAAPAPHATGTPDMPAPGWAEIPGAIGCTAESCAFRDREASFQALGASVMGLSAQSTDAQSDFAARKDIRFPLLSDPDLKLSMDPGLPTFQAGHLHLYKRLTLVAESGRIVKVFYPVFPPDTHPA